jgi:hypothetical protein
MISIDPSRDLAVMNALERIGEAARENLPSARLLVEAAGSLRMLLIDRQIAKSAASHGIRLEITATDNRFIKSVEPLSKVSFFMSGGCTVGLVRLDPFVVAATGVAVPPISVCLTRRMMLGKFLDDPVLCVMGRIVTRAEVIHYVANKMGGVHYDAKRDREFQHAIDRARSAVSFRLEGGQVVQEVNFDFLHDTVPAFEFLPSRLDCALIQILSTCTMLHQSPDVGALSVALVENVARSQSKPK